MIKKAEIKLKGSSVFYRYLEDNDNSKSVLLLHGMSFTSADWEKNEILESITKLGFNVYAVDFPGFGNSEKSETYSISGQNVIAASNFVRDFSEQVMDNLECIIGPSMGGFIALSAVSQYPLISKKAILVAPAGFELLRDSLKNIEADTALIWGTDDSVIPIQIGREMVTMIPKCRLFEVEGAGHPVYLEKPSEFMSTVGKFLGE